MIEGSMRKKNPATLPKLSFLVRYFPTLLAIGCALILCGCAGYRLGPTNGLEPGAKAVQINPVVNQTMEPRFGDAVTSALRKQLQRDGTYRLATRGGADIVVSGTITHFSRRELSLLPNDVLTARDYRLNATMVMTARDTNTGKIIFEKPVTGYTLLRVGNDLASAERQAIPLLAEDLAKNVTAMLVDGTW
jgi:hypothetical protein